jgi:adenylate kinase family enzyme
MFHGRRTELEPPHRVLVVGCPGGGIASLGHAISERLGIPLVDLEAGYWRSGALAPSETEWRGRIGEWAATEQWVMVGPPPASMELLVARADWLVFVDLPMAVCLLRAVRDMARRLAREETARRFDTRILRFIWTFATRHVPQIHALIARERRNRSIFILRTSREREDFIARVPILGDMGSGLPGDSAGR